MKVSSGNIIEYLNTPNVSFVVPVYQRNYDWKEANCTRLFDDICRIIDTGKEHFIGSICYQAERKSGHETRVIIDGQQRMTSILLLLKAVSDVDLIRNENLSINLDVKLQLSDVDSEDYQQLKSHKGHTKVEDYFKHKSDSRIFQNYETFYKLAEKYESLSNLLAALNKLTIVELEVTEENPQEVFESLNNTGVDLSNVDLLRNYLLMPLPYEKQKELYKNYWHNVEKNVKPENMGTFFVDYLIYKRRSDAVEIEGRKAHINGDNLYAAFKKYYEHNAETYNFMGPMNQLEKVEKLLLDMKECSETYHDFLFFKIDENDNSIEQKNNRKLFYLLAVNHFYKTRSLLLFIYRLKLERSEITDAVIGEILDAVTTLCFRAKVCGRKGIDGQYAGNLIAKFTELDDYSDFADQFWREIVSRHGSYEFPDDDDFKNDLLTKNLYRLLGSKTTKYMLFMFERYSPVGNGTQPFERGTMTVEHILPQTLSKEWRENLDVETLESYDIFVAKLGNLALTNDNQHMSNDPFATKKESYEKSTLFHTRELTKFDNWTSAEINDRSEKLANEALKIWRLPEQYQNNEETFYHLPEKKSKAFNFRKPKILMIHEEKFKLYAWSEMLPKVCEVLFQDNGTVLKDMAREGRFRVLKLESALNPDKEKKFFKLVNDEIYVRVDLSTSNILDFTRRIAKAFDEKAGTDYADQITFTIR